jgi:hypothetical protein
MATIPNDAVDIQKSEDCSTEPPSFDFRAYKLFALERWNAAVGTDDGAMKNECESAITAAADIARAKRISGRRTRKWLMLFNKSRAASKAQRIFAFKKSFVARLQWKRLYVRMRFLQEKIISTKWFGFFMKITRFLRFKAAVEDGFGIVSGAPNVTVGLGECGAVRFVYKTRVSDAFGVRNNLDEKPSLKEAIEAFKSGAMRKTYTRLQSLHVLDHAKSVLDFDFDDDADNFCLQFMKALSIVKICSACKKATYCNARCQKAHWKVHKKVCSK